MTRRFDSLRSEVLGTSTRFGISELFYPASDQLTFYSNTLVDFTPLFLFFSVFFLFSFFFLFSPLPASELAGPRRIAGNLKLRAKHIRDESRKPGENWSPLRRSNCNERQSPRKLRFHSLRIGKLRYFQLWFENLPRVLISPVLTAEILFRERERDSYVFAIFHLTKRKKKKKTMAAITAETNGKFI